jgi:probable phosphoglycerate mutase
LDSNFFSGLKNAVNFFIIRHGQSEGNAAKILQGRGEYPLSEAGRRQSAARSLALKTALAGATPGKTLLFSSPQIRARETAEIITQQLSTAQIITEETALSEPLYLDELMEMSLGIWTGKDWEQVQNDDPSLWSDFMARSWDAIPHAESSLDLYDRSLRLWAVLRDKAIEQNAENIIVVTHGGLIQWLVKSTLLCRSWFPMLPISNCGQFKFCVKPHPAGKNAYTGWEEIDSPLPDQDTHPQGFPA